MVISGDAMLIAGAILILAIVIAWSWIRTRDKELKK